MASRKLSLRLPKFPALLHGLQIAVPRWSPDGKIIAFIGGLMSDQGSTGGDVWIVSVRGRPAARSDGRKADLSCLDRVGNQRLSVCERARWRQQPVDSLQALGRSHSRRTKCTFGSPIFSIPGSVGDGRLEMAFPSTADHSMFVFGASTFDHPARNLRCQTRHGHDVGPGRRDAALALQRWRAAGMGQVGVAELEERWIPRTGLAAAAQGLRSEQEVSADRRGPWRSGGRGDVPAGAQAAG